MVLIKHGVCLQHKQSLAPAGATEAHTPQEASVSGQPQLASTKQVSPQGLTTHLDQQLSELHAPAGQASDIASSSASDMLACSQRLSDMYNPMAGGEGLVQGRQAGKIDLGAEHLQNAPLPASDSSKLQTRSRDDNR